MCAMPTASGEVSGSQTGNRMGGLRFGLCCAFRGQPIKFGNTTVAAIRRLNRPAALVKLSRLCLANADALLASLQFCAAHGIGCFRINSQILPIKTHPECGYQVEDLPQAAEIVERFRACGEFASAHGLRTCFHPDQFVVLNSPREDVVTHSVAEIEYQAQVAEWVAADVINIHAGGAYGDKTLALGAFARGLDRLSPAARLRLTVENDDTIYSPQDLLPLCKREGLPFVYDVHHHRCLPDDLTIEEATAEAAATWNREPLLHISSPLAGWRGIKPERHHDLIRIRDFPDCWYNLRATVEVEAKAKELAVFRLMNSITRRMKTLVQ